MFTFTRNEETTSSKKAKTNETENEETKNVEAEKEETKDTESENKETKDADVGDLSFECDLSGVGRLSGCLYLQCARGGLFQCTNRKQTYNTTKLQPPDGHK